MSDSHTRPFHERAERIRADYLKQAQAVRDDVMLSDLAKTRRLAELYRDAADRLQAERIKMREVIDAELLTVERSLFGAGQDPAGYRDALDRAEATADPGAALRLLERAGRTGDQQLARAVALVAWDRSWEDVVHTYRAGVSPSEQQAFTKYAELLAQRNRTAQGKFVEAMTFGLPRPAELGGRSPEQVLAATEPPAEPTGWLSA
jgi:hypothetical protein